jgi:hypothetical protein
VASLGFENYTETLKIYLSKDRDVRLPSFQPILPFVP